MKGAAKCDNHCELQNSVNQLGFEGILRFWDIPKSMLTSVPYFHVPSNIQPGNVFVCQWMSTGTCTILACSAATLAKRCRALLVCAVAEHC